MNADEVYQTAKEALDSAKSAHHRIDELAQEVKDIHSLTAAMATVNEKVDNLDKSLGELKDNVKALTSRPGKWWDSLVGYGMAAVIAALVGLLFAHIH